MLGVELIHNASLTIPRSAKQRMQVGRIEKRAAELIDLMSYRRGVEVKLKPDSVKLNE